HPPQFPPPADPRHHPGVDQVHPRVGDHQVARRRPPQRQLLPHLDRIRDPSVPPPHHELHLRRQLDHPLIHVRHGHTLTTQSRGKTATPQYTTAAARRMKDAGGG